MDSLSIEGAWTFTPRQFPDDRGAFLEAFRGEEFAADLGYRLDVAQVNCSVSRRGVIRGIHYADVPPGQAKYVSCVRGAILDVVVDIRVGSESFGSWDAVRLDDRERKSLFLAEGLGHGFMALTDDATVLYLCSTGYAPGREHGLNPLDRDLGIEWNLDEIDGEPILSAKDAEAPSLSEAETAGLLPRYEDCLGYAEHLRAKLSGGTHHHHPSGTAPTTAHDSLAPAWPSLPCSYPLPVALLPKPAPVAGVASL